MPPVRPYQKALIQDTARDALTVSATQVGKTFCLALWIVAMSLKTPSPVHPWWWLAPTYNQVVQGFRLVSTFVLSAGVAAAQPVMTPYPTVKLINGSSIEFRSWEREQNLMGTTIAGGVVDEAGLLSPEAQAAISTRRSETLGPLRYIGNPGITAGPFRRLCQYGEQARNPDSEWSGIYSLHKWTWEDKYRALLLEDRQKAAEYKTFINQERNSLPDYEFRRLYDAAWTEDEAAVFRGVDKVVKGGDLLSAGQDQFVIGVDVGQVVDYLAAVSMGANTRRMELREHFRGVSMVQAAQRLKTLQDNLNGAPLVVEVNNQGLALTQELERIGAIFIPFTTTAQSKQEIILGLAADIQAEVPRVEIAETAPLPYEMSIYRYQRMPSGHYRYEAPAGEHDDTVMAAALARWGIQRALIDVAQYGWA